jgi:hypothetical protein
MRTHCRLCGHRRRVWWMAFFAYALCEPCIKRIDWRNPIWNDYA